MYSTIEIWIFTLLGAGIGAVAGYFLHQRLHPAPRRNRELEAQLEELQEQHKHYRYDVNTHFNTTADLLSNLAASYREVHNHLTRGALDLCDPGSVRTLKMLPEATPVLEEQHSTALEPPRDYALKEPNEKGMLAEDYGFEKKRSPTFPEPPRY